MNSWKPYPISTTPIKEGEVDPFWERIREHSMPMPFQLWDSDDPEIYKMQLENAGLKASPPTTGLRYNTGKPEISMVLEANKAVEGASIVLMYGRDKYHRGNWLGGLDHMGIVDCLMRHLTAYVAGEDKDAESGLPHVDHVLANALFLSQMVHTRPDLDDRVKL